MSTDERGPVLRIAGAKVVIEVIVECVPKSTVDTGMQQGRTLVSVWDCLSTHRDKSCPAHWTLIARFVDLSDQTRVAERMSAAQCGVVTLEILQAARTFDNRADFVLSSVFQGVTALATFKVKVA
jgi:hypothetical protein